jgi:glycerol uptake facilitator protein
MSSFTGELIGTALLILLGNGVVANVALKGTKGSGSGWIVITFGWGMAVFVAVAVVARASGAHINPAVSLALATSGNLPWAQVPLYWTAQVLGAMLGALLVFLVYRRHFESTDDADAKLAAFCTAPAIRGVFDNFFSELVGTLVLALAVLEMARPDVGLGALDALPVGLLVLAIGLSLGGTTGYAINPARDLGPRLVHALLPGSALGGKRDSDFGYAWVPVVGPLAGALLAAGLHTLLR